MPCKSSQSSKVTHRSVSSKTLTWSCLVLSQWLCWKCAKKVCGLNTSQPVLKPVICALCALLLAHSLLCCSCFQQSAWMPLHSQQELYAADMVVTPSNHKAESQRLFSFVEVAAVSMKNQFHTFFLFICWQFRTKAGN